MLKFINNVTAQPSRQRLSSFQVFAATLTLLHEGTLGCLDLAKALWSPSHLPPGAILTLPELFTLPLLILILLWSALTTFYHSTTPFEGEAAFILLAVSVATKAALTVHTCLIAYNIARRGVKDLGLPLLQIFLALELHSTGFFNSSKEKGGIAFFISSTRLDALFALFALAFWYLAFSTDGRTPADPPPPHPVPLAAQRTIHIAALKRLHATHAADLRAERKRSDSLLHSERQRFATALSTASKRHGDWYTQHFNLAQREWKIWVRSVVERAEEKVLRAQREMERALSVAGTSRAEMEKAREEVKEAMEAEARAKRELGGLKGSIGALLVEVKEGQELAFKNIRRLEDQVEYWEERCGRLEAEGEGFGFVGREEVEEWEEEEEEEEEDGVLID